MVLVRKDSIFVRFQWRKTFKTLLKRGGLYISIYLALFGVQSFKMLNKSSLIMTIVMFCLCVLSHSVVSNSVTPRTVALQAPLSVGFPRQEHGSGLPCLPPGDLPNARI